MDRRRALGIALAAVSACGYGSGPLFAKSVYGAGLDWLALLYWRFLLAGLLVWAWAKSPTRFCDCGNRLPAAMFRWA